MDNCKLVADTSCPKLAAECVVFDHVLKFRSFPFSSPGSSMPVLLPNPNFLNDEYVFSLPNKFDILTIPILLECINISSIVSSL